MPYISANRRDIARHYPATAGELNFAITDLLCYYIRFKTLNYQTISDIVGALVGAKLEFYARVVRPYEDKKRKENGDVYEEWSPAVIGDNADTYNQIGKEL